MLRGLTVEKYSFIIVPATQELINQLKGNLRKEDIEEVRAFTGQDADEALQESFDLSTKCWVGLLNGEPCFAGGVAPASVLTVVGVPWMLGTDKLRKVGYTFIKKSKKLIQEMLEGFEVLENYVDTRNTLSRKWLTWCGFTLDEPEAIGVELKAFHHY